MWLQTILVYSGLTLVMYLLARYAVLTGRWRFVVLAIVLYAIIFGIRYGVGMDSITYMHMYNWGFFGAYSDTIEWGFKNLGLLFYHAGAHYSIFFGVLAFLQIYLLFHSARGHSQIWSYLPVVIMLGAYWLPFCNGMRQMTAFSIFAFSLPFVAQKNYVGVALSLVAASLMHRSALILAPVYLMLFQKEEWFHNIKYQLIAVATAMVIGSFNVVEYLAMRFHAILVALNYDRYLAGYSEKMFEEVQFGIGFYVTFAAVLLMILYSNRIKAHFDSPWVTQVYNLFFVGVVLHYLFINSQLGGRVNMYFSNFSIFFFALSLSYLKHVRSKSFWMLLLCLFLTFTAYMYRADTSTAMYYTFWQQHLYKRPF